ncbi:30S ribosomal protein S19 [Candidatus Woesearchaeota archaeon]|jgi:small subunit ribosomal protein S19|nr:30S ribosomal protein S19 [Candidatus Woesearchaeota archaeon]MBT6044679.1 30S ribosomal protein S19 [Candidatus Woesearchaeota archaeon]
MDDDEFRFKGKTLAELKQMDVKEFAKLLTSRKRRTISRDVLKSAEPLLEKIRLTNEGKRKKPIKTHLRVIPVLPQMVGLKIGVHNGKEFHEIVITEEMLGLFLGELSQTRKRLSHGSAGVGATKSSTASASKAK